MTRADTAEALQPMVGAELSHRLMSAVSDLSGNSKGILPMGSALKDWQSAMNRFAIIFPDRIGKIRKMVDTEIMIGSPTSNSHWAIINHGIADAVEPTVVKDDDFLSGGNENRFAVVSTIVRKIKHRAICTSAVIDRSWPARALNRVTVAPITVLGGAF